MNAPLTPNYTSPAADSGADPQYAKTEQGVQKLEAKQTASTSAPGRLDGDMLRGPAAGDGQNVAAVGSAPATATNFTLSDAMADLDVANRCPTYSEFQKASPCMQRAIKRRWHVLGKSEFEEKQIHEKEAAYFKSQAEGCERDHANFARYRKEAERAEWLRRVRNGDFDQDGYSNPARAAIEDDESSRLDGVGPMRAHDWGV